MPYESETKGVQPIERVLKEDKTVETKPKDANTIHVWLDNDLTIPKETHYELETTDTDTNVNDTRETCLVSMDRITENTGSDSEITVSKETHGSLETTDAKYSVNDTRETCLVSMDRIPDNAGSESEVTVSKETHGAPETTDTATNVNDTCETCLMSLDEISENVSFYFCIICEKYYCVKCHQKHDASHQSVGLVVNKEEPETSTGNMLKVHYRSLMCFRNFKITYLSWTDLCNRFPFIRW